MPGEGKVSKLVVGKQMCKFQADFVVGGLQVGEILWWVSRGNQSSRQSASEHGGWLSGRGRVARVTQGSRAGQGRWVSGRGRAAGGEPASGRSGRRGVSSVAILFFSPQIQRTQIFPVISPESGSEAHFNPVKPNPGSMVNPQIYHGTAQTRTGHFPWHTQQTPFGFQIRQHTLSHSSGNNLTHGYPHKGQELPFSLLSSLIIILPDRVDDSSPYPSHSQENLCFEGDAFTPLRQNSYIVTFTSILTIVSNSFYPRFPLFEIPYRTNPTLPLQHLLKPPPELTKLSQKLLTGGCTKVWRLEIIPQQHTLSHSSGNDFIHGYPHTGQELNTLTLSLEKQLFQEVNDSYHSLSHGQENLCFDDLTYIRTHLIFYKLILFNSFNPRFPLFEITHRIKPPFLSRTSPLEWPQTFPEGRGIRQGLDRVGIMERVWWAGKRGDVEGDGVWQRWAASDSPPHGSIPPNGSESFTLVYHPQKAQPSALIILKWGDVPILVDWKGAKNVLNLRPSGCSLKTLC
ncbi:hypothetical protein VP01_77g2 [Puccinia sorghi]|uniref:Uncharacterized protein n=1 Tax=Puccinia sorghi TaxID=27349 RepID=A0A0L6UB61_9BASI|nr:hypothetical protein VP01_77g2 [Puccinia sorghi]